MVVVVVVVVVRGSAGHALAVLDQCGVAAGRDQDLVRMAFVGKVHRNGRVVLRVRGGLVAMWAGCAGPGEGQSVPRSDAPD